MNTARRSVARDTILLSLMVLSMAGFCGDAPSQPEKTGADLTPDSLSPAAKATIDALRALPESERAAVLNQLGVKTEREIRLPDSVAKNLDEPEKKDEEKDKKDELYSIHYQTTIITQKHDALQKAPYTGAFSLAPKEDQKTSATATVFFGRHLWDGGELYFNPEISGGEGLSKVNGIAGFPNGDIEKVGSPAPAPYVARLFLRETFNLGGESEKLEDGFNQVAGARDVNRVTVQFGKVAATDVFDTNTYAHDPRTQFMDWAIMDYGAWDYAADTRGYTPGLSVEYNRDDGWALRYGVFMVPRRANSAIFDFSLGKANAQNLEVERRYKLFGKDGAVRVLGYDNNAHMGSYREAVDAAIASGNTPNLIPTRKYRAKIGFGINAEEEIFKDVGGFLRASWNDGRSETWMFTEIDRSLSIGATVKGTRWSRPDDVIGLGGVVNGLSPDHRDFLAAGGTGFIIGDGRLNYSPEKILETYYSLRFHANMSLSVYYQFVGDPAYNQDRGPVNIGSVRLHVEF